jgi:DNA-binding NarL/FixJ family response regulator
LKRHLPKLEVVLFTMHDQEELVADLLRAGVRGFVLKSEAEQHLLDAIDAVSLHRTYLSRTVSETLISQAIDHNPLGKSSLTRREREVVQLVAEGGVNKQVAYSLDISIKTVETHRAAAMRKLNLGTTADLVRYAIRNRIVQA